MEEFRRLAGQRRTRPRPTNPNAQRRYNFTYDGLGRLKDARYQARTAPWTGWNSEVGAYDERGITYDANGNIKSLTRYTQVSATATPTLLDQLSYDYTNNGNRPEKRG